MKKELSIYLDLVRFTAAMVVFLGHASGNLTGGFLWQLHDYLHAAVMIFFVLSGFVIAFVYDTKEKTIEDYSIARISRLTSVVLPALFITVICDQIGMMINYELYFGGPWPPPKNEWLNYILTVFLVQNIWGLNLNPGINVPFWSLSYELLFYCLFAAAFYLKGKKRIIVFSLFALLAGPDILVLFPIWLIGVVLYYAIKKDSSVYERYSFACSCIAVLSLLVLLVGTPWIKANIKFTFDFLIVERDIVADYFYAILFSIHLFFIPPLLKKIKPLLMFFVNPISFFASLTFSLYLFHRPLIQFFATFSEDLSSIESRILVIGGTFLVTVFFGHWCEKKKYNVKVWVKKIFTSAKGHA